MAFADDDAGALDEWAGSHHPIVVAVDGSVRNQSAVDWAAHEAGALGCRLDLVTALPDRILDSPQVPTDDDVGALDMLARTRSTIVHLVADQQVTTAAVPGTPLDVLLERARGARLLVVGKRGLGSFARVIVGSTSIALAGRSPVPVAIVPERWQQAEHAEGPVVLGVDPHRPDHRAFHLAFRRADHLGVPLVAVHGWESPAVYSWDAAGVAGISSQWEQEATALFEQVVKVWQDRFPRVSVRAAHRHKHPANAVLEESADAQLVVLGRHSEGIFGGFAFGSVARAVLHYVETPVIVVPTEPVLTNGDADL